MFRREATISQEQNTPKARFIFQDENGFKELINYQFETNTVMFTNQVVVSMKSIQNKNFASGVAWFPVNSSTWVRIQTTQ